MSTDFDSAFNSLWSDVSEPFPTGRPLLAHYTSIAALESIMARDEMWFSNPLYMTDIEELRFGMNEGAFAFRMHPGIKKACGTDARYQLLLTAFEHFVSEFEDRHAFDTYVLCFSEHDPKHTDGLLSMWRGYGGNGSGAAIVLDTAQLDALDESPLIISRVVYAADDARLRWIHLKLEEVADILTRVNPPNEKLHVAAYMFLERLKLFALFTKHHGFHEEREWRVVYLSQRDEKKLLQPMLHYAIGTRGLEPKLKLRIEPIDGVTGKDMSLPKLVSQIILGPSMSSPVAVMSVRRMLERVGKSALADRVSVVASHDGGITVFASWESGRVVGSRVSLIDSATEVPGD